MADNTIKSLVEQYLVENSPAESDYLGLIRKLVEMRAEKKEDKAVQGALEKAYLLLEKEIIANALVPLKPVSFGTSGWRGKLGKDFFVKSVCQVAQAVIETVKEADSNNQLAKALGVDSFTSAQGRGCVLGYDNRFAADLLADQVGRILVANGIRVYFCGETTTGVLSSCVLQKKAAFSINLTPSHNPLEYSGFKFNGADAGPASTLVTDRITSHALRIVASEKNLAAPVIISRQELLAHPLVTELDSLKCWQDHLDQNHHSHGLNLQNVRAGFYATKDLVVAVDCIHGASRSHIGRIFAGGENDRLIILRAEKDVTFGGVSPEPSGENLKSIRSLLAGRPEPLKIGAIIDPDGDRIRFTDGKVDISMNQFGAMAYHFLQRYKGKKGLVGKTVATSNFANAIASSFREDCFEPAVGFKNFKPVIETALVIFEESDGISVAGHTPEKDAYIGLVLALEMVLATRMSLGDYLRVLEQEYGTYHCKRGSFEVEVLGAELLDRLTYLDRYTAGTDFPMADHTVTVKETLRVDGHKLVFEDGSWLMIRPSGTEPKVRYYVESKTREGTRILVDAAYDLLGQIGLVGSGSPI